MPASLESFEDYRDEVKSMARSIWEEWKENTDNVEVKGDLWDKAEIEIRGHRWVNSEGYYLPLIQHAETTPDEVRWKMWLDFDNPEALRASDIWGAQAYSIFHQDVMDVLRGIVEEDEESEQTLLS